MPEQLDLPLHSWDESRTLTKRDGGKLKRWGSIQQATKILDDCDREALYILIRAGLIKAYKLQPHRPNSHWRVDLLSVWEHKQSQLRNCA